MTRFYLQYSITTKSSLFFRLVVQAPRRLTILRCLWKKKSVFRAWLSWLPSQVHHDLELSHECFQVGDVSCQLHHLDGNHCFFLPRLDPESISLHHLGRERESQYPGRNPPCKRADPLPFQRLPPPAAFRGSNVLAGTQTPCVQLMTRILRERVRFEIKRIA